MTLRDVAEFKAHQFLTESNRSSMMYEVKRARAMWDPSLSVPGTDRRGGWRCPVGTRYGGQITDRFGRNCGWGVARRLANEISDLGERLENVGDQRRARKLRQREERMVGRLQGGAGRLERLAGRIADVVDPDKERGNRRERRGVNAPEAGRVERAAGRIADVLESDNNRGRGRRTNAPEAPAAPEAPRAPRGRRTTVVEPKPRPAAQRRPRRNLRPSEERRMQREIDQPNAPRTGEAVPEAAPRPRPVPQRRPANARRPRREPAARPKPAPQPEVPAAVEKPAAAVKPAAVEKPAAAAVAERRAAPRVPNFVPKDGLDNNLLQNFVGDDIAQQRFDEMDAMRRHQVEEQLPGQMEMWGVDNINEMEQAIEFRRGAIEQARQDVLDAMNEYARRFNEEDGKFDRRADRAEEVLRRNEQLRGLLNIQTAQERRLRELQKMRDGGGNIPEPEVPNIPEPPVVPNPPSIESAVPARERRIGPNDNLVGFTASDWRQLFEDQGHDGVPERVRRAQDAVRRGRDAGDAEFANVFGDENRVREGRIRGDRADAVTRYEAQLQRLEQNERRAKETYDRYQNRPNDGQLLQAQRDYIAALAARQRFQEQRQALDAGLAMDAPQPLDPEMARKAEQRVKDAIEGRQRILAEHLNRRYGEGNAPWKEMTLEKRQDLLRKAQRGTPEEKRAAVAELEAWATAMYNHEEIRGSNGKTYRTVARASLSPGNASISVGVSIQVKDANGRWSEVGTSSRSILLNENKVYNGTMFIRAAGHKNNGIQTIYNQHAFMYAKAAGFEKFGVTAVDDGPYVWGRVGFETNGPISGGAVGRMAAQLSAFRRGEESIIKNEEDANIIKYLLDKYDDDPGSVRHMDFIYALTNAGQTKAQKKARDREMRDWFVSNMPMGGGTFYLDKNMIKADPRD